MEPKFQTSFIPKTPITGGSSTPSFRKESSFSIVGTASTVLFVFALLVSGGLFAYQTYMNGEVKKSQIALTDAREAFQSPDNEKIILASDQLKSIKLLLSSHTLVSPVFELLETSTLPTVRLTSFSFSRGVTGIVVVSIEAEAQSYASLAQQAKIFSELKYLKNLQFIDISLSETGTVRTKLKAELDPEMLLYTKKIQSVSMLTNLSL